MKRAVFLIVGLMVVAQVRLDAQEAMDPADLVRSGDVHLHPQTREPYTGAVEAWWNPGTLKERGTMKEGRWDGSQEYYHLNGKLSGRMTYREGVLHGPTETYFKSGQLSDRGSFKDGEWDGPYEAYWARGRLAERGTWTAGERCGEWEIFGRTVSHPPCPGQR